MPHVTGEKTGSNISYKELELLLSGIRMKIKHNFKKMRTNIDNNWKPENGATDVVKYAIYKYGRLYIKINHILKSERWNDLNEDFDEELINNFIKNVVLSKEFNFTDDLTIRKYVNNIKER